ncbi:STING domain-containing protein [Zunongwangia sp. H14]|uniref:STING domain-containing protein n=1 Tax=Zunongwangia sp. H14 TaxID=3240792 RepID=UPI003561558A
MTKLRLIFTLGFIKEAFTSFVPTVLAYLQFYEEKLDPKFAITLAIFTFLLLFITMLLLKIREYRKSVARALAYGYYKNFVEKICNLIEAKGRNKIKFIFQHRKEEFDPDHITIHINLANSYLAFEKKFAKIKSSYKIAYIDSDAYNHPFFVYAKIKKNKIIIEDIPRTLFALKFYVDPDLDSLKKINKETLKYFSSFNEEFQKLWSRIDTSINFHLKPAAGEMMKRMVN